MNSLDYIKSLHTSFQRLQQQSTSGSSTNRQQLIEEARSELIGHLDFIQGDVDDLQASVEAVQESGSRWGISDAEVKERKRFLNEVVDNVRVRTIRRAKILLRLNHEHIRTSAPTRKAIIDGLKKARQGDRHPIVADPLLHRLPRASKERSMLT